MATQTVVVLGPPLSTELSTSLAARLGGTLATMSSLVAEGSEGATAEARQLRTMLEAGKIVPAAAASVR